jgi:hypothetical protein
MHKYKSLEAKFQRELKKGKLTLRRGRLYMRLWQKLQEMPRTRQMLLRLHWQWLRLRTKAIAPALIGAVSTVAVAGYQASVSKNNSDNAALVALGDSAADADIMRSVTQMATVGLDQESVSVGGDYTVAGGDMDRSIDTSTASSTASTETSSVTESTSSVTDSYNQTTYTTTDGTKVSLEDIEALIGAGLTVKVIIDNEEVEVEQCPNGGLTFGGGSC